MCHTLRERKSKSLDKGCSVERERERKKERKKERKEKKEKERKGKKEKREVIFAGFWVLSTGR